MPSKKPKLLLRPPEKITYTILWLALEKKRDINEIASDLLEVGIRRLNIPLRDEPPPKPLAAPVADKEAADETAHSVPEVVGH